AKIVLVRLMAASPKVSAGRLLPPPLVIGSLTGIETPSAQRPVAVSPASLTHPTASLLPSACTTLQHGWAFPDMHVPELTHRAMPRLTVLPPWAKSNVMRM